MLYELVSKSLQTLTENITRSNTFCSYF